MLLKIGNFGKSEYLAILDKRDHRRRVCCISLAFRIMYLITQKKKWLSALHISKTSHPPAANRTKLRLVSV